MATHISQRDARDDAARTDRCVVDIAACVTDPCRRRTHPRDQAWEFDQPRRPAGSRPCLRTPETPRLARSDPQATGRRINRHSFARDLGGIRPMRLAFSDRPCASSTSPPTAAPGRWRPNRMRARLERNDPTGAHIPLCTWEQCSVARPRNQWRRTSSPSEACRGLQASGAELSADVHASSGRG